MNYKIKFSNANRSIYHHHRAPLNENRPRSDRHRSLAAAKHPLLDSGPCDVRHSALV